MSKTKYPHLKGLIAQNNYNQNILAKELGITYQALSEKMLRKKDFKIKEIEHIIKLFKKPFEYIFFVPELVDKTTSTINCTTNSITDSEIVANM